MAKRARRKNEQLLVWLRAAGVAVATYAGLLSMHFQPQWGAGAFALLAGGLAVSSVDLGVTVAVLCLAVPLIAINPVAGIAFAVLAVVSVRYLGADGGRVFLLIATALFGAFAGPVWAAAVIAGFLMGATEGAVAAAAACLAVEAAAIAVGAGSVVAGTTLVAGSSPLLDFADAPASLFSAAWIPEAFSAVDAGAVDSFISAIAGVSTPVALIVQPAIWALGAVATAALVGQARARRSVALMTAAAAVGAFVPAAGTVALSAALKVAVPWADVAFATASSAALAALFVAVYEFAFPVLAVPVRHSVATEDAEVDELLRLIATAEEKLATHHTTTKVVMITDMKSFSRMTEEDGSIVTAKAIQKHRDLVLPIIESHHGHGKSTGGDGLVAAFDRPVDALEASVGIQRALASHNEAKHTGREIGVRIGVARGEVVLDKSGRPFIGNALNLAARIMNLADGGQVFVASNLLSVETSALRTYSHGAFELKNIAKPVEVVEILWGPNQRPRTPGEHGDDSE